MGKCAKKITNNCYNNNDDKSVIGEKVKEEKNIKVKPICSLFQVGKR
jgi:hypothetical protein